MSARSLIDVCQGWREAGDEEARESVRDAVREVLIRESSRAQAFDRAIARAGDAATEADALRAFERVGVPAKARPFRVARSFRANPPPRPWIVPDWLPEGRIGLLAGKGGRGKSWVSAQLACAIAGGDPDWLPGAPKATTEGDGHTVVVWSYEDEAEEYERRLASLRAKEGLHPFRADLGDRLHIIDASDEGPLWAPGGGGSKHTSTVGEITDTGARVRAYCEEHGARLLVVDPLAGAFACNENDRALVSRFMYAWDSWARRNACAVLIVSHPPKHPSDDDPYSGSTGWHASSRFMWSLGIPKPPKRNGKGKNGDEPQVNENPVLKNEKENYSSAGARGLYEVHRNRSGKWVASPRAPNGPGPDGGSFDFT